MVCFPLSDHLKICTWRCGRKNNVRMHGGSGQTLHQPKHRNQYAPRTCRQCIEDAHTHADTHADTPTHRHTDTQTHRHTDTPTHRHTDTQTHRHTDTQTHRHTDTQTRRHADTQTQTQTLLARTHTDTQNEYMIKNPSSWHELKRLTCSKHVQHQQSASKSRTLERRFGEMILRNALRSSKADKYVD